MGLDNSRVVLRVCCGPSPTASSSKPPVHAVLCSRPPEDVLSLSFAKEKDQLSSFLAYFA